MNLSKSRAVDRPIHESNLHELEHCQHPQSELLSFILCAWIMTSTQSRGDMIHGDPLQHGLFLQKSSCHDLSITLHILGQRLSGWLLFADGLQTSDVSNNSL